MKLFSVYFTLILYNYVVYFLIIIPFLFNYNFVFKGFELFGIDTAF